MKKIFLYIVLLLFSHEINSAVPDPSINEYFSSQGVNVKIHYDKAGNHTFRYIETYKNEKVETLIFLLHGANSSAMKFKKIMADSTLLKFSRIVALDRPGYGNSSPGNPLVSIDAQSDLVKQILEKYNYKTCILVGHSYGAPIVANYAAKHSEQDLKLLLLSAAIDPEKDFLFPSSKLVLNENIRNLFPTRMQAAAYENLVHKEELIKIKPIWSMLDLPVHHIHGVMDAIISYENVYFSQENIRNDKLTIELIEGVGHMLVRFKKDKIIESIINLSKL